MSFAEWKTVPLGDHCEILSGYPFKSSGFTDDPDDIPLVKGENIGQGEILWSISKRWPRTELDELKRFMLLPGDVVLAMDRPWVPAGLKFARIPDSCPESLLVQRVARLRASDGLEQRLLPYVIGSPAFAAYVQNTGRGVGVPHISGKEIARFSFPLPPPPTQMRIADTLCAYDDQIENNRRRMELLEEAARLLYREWFVRLRFPGHEHSRVLDGIPEGWERRPLGCCAKFLSGGTPSKATTEYWEGDIPWVSSGELTTMRIHDTSLHITSEAAEAGSRLVPPDTILAVVRGMSLAKEFRMAMVGREVAFNQDLKALVSQPGVDAVYLFHALETQRDQIRDRATEASHGTKKLDTPVLASVPILLPPFTLQEHFRGIVDPMNLQWDVLRRQTERLRAARDLLLPRLMSGEIAV
jgi:type I restriction enzyme S subunit